MKKNVVIGIDFSKLTLDVTFFNTDNPKEKHYPGPTLDAVGSGRRSGGAGERARAEGAWLRRPPFITG